MLLYGLGLNPSFRQNVGPLPGQVSTDPGLVLKPMTDYDRCLQAHLQAPCGGAKTIVEAKARCDAKTPPPVCGGADGEGEGGGDGGGAEPGFFAKHKTKLLIGGGLLAAYLVLRR